MPRNKAPLDPDRQMMIKTKTCQRLLKEHEYYKKEVQENKAILQQMKDDQKDPHDIKRFEQVLGESHMMVPDSAKRLQASLEDLHEFMTTYENTASEWYQTGQAILTTHDKQAADLEIPETQVDDTLEAF